MTKPLRVALFVGHKGPGTGAQDDPLTPYNEDEFDNAQKAACAIGANLLLRHHQPLVITGEGDDYLVERVRLALKSRCDLAIGCHFNAVADRRANGCEVLAHPADESSWALASVLANHIAQRTGVELRHKGSFGTVEVGGLAVLSAMFKAKTPAAIIEPLFLSNEEDQQVLASDGYWRDLATAVCDAIDIWAAVWKVMA